ncbi:hypothetical protein IJH89_02465, partial [Candidatus Saccharibacteria bacterium]|nr:hypothetical protein [Candidatus Saccharibacteria bacterium]
MSKTEWKEQKIKLSSAIVCAVLFLVAGFAVGVKWNNYSPYLGGKISSDKSISWSELNEVYNTLASNYDGDFEKSDIIEGAKKGLVEAVGDQYTVYMTKDETAEFNKSLHGDVGAGVGIEIGFRDDYTRVIRTLPDNPAKKAGVIAGDIIYKID